ncbi:MAG: ABC transporter permease subunit [Geminicoccaceae bacterium]|nr:ABC transporter permease subunit [Geminicoccaceae bacterium]MCS7266472.1 ABC transporter permease subunit [Geminicoccaceae bacterium]MCX7629399.1 ABC transporter permease subunit [Geminicoccaceae bacterium]MDW8123932.1 ABC transporter permease subunit [Geminicoccaceae bacterium]MDW8340005.1 ABC transporter permease subunit [Geminicoccaceae bacterium]
MSATELAAAVAPARPERVRRFEARRLRAPLSVLLLLGLWAGTAWLLAAPRLFPGPASVLEAVVRELVAGELLFHLGWTLLRVAAAFALAMLVGAAIGIAMGRVAVLDDLGRPWLLFFLNLPALVTIVLCYVWIGLVEAAAVIAVAINKIPNVAVTVREGARALDKSLFEMARVFAVPRLAVLEHVVLPQLAPYFLAAARSGLALVWKIVLVVELLGRPNGVGFQIHSAFQLFDVATVLAYALAFMGVVQLVEWLGFQPLQRRLERWRR